jgi:hypothetical protein
MASKVKHQMIIEAHGDFVWVKHVVSMRQVKPNKASRRKPNKCFRIIKTTHDFFQSIIKQSQWFETIHATAKTTKHTIKTTSSMAWKSLSRSLNKFLFVPLFLHETFSLFQHHSNLFGTNLLMNTNIDQRSKYTLMQR